jgi:transposase
MTNYREILRLDSQGISQRSISASCECSRNTVSSTLKRAEVQGISWPLPKGMSDGDLIECLFPERLVPSSRRLQAKG